MTISLHPQVWVRWTWVKLPILTWVGWLQKAWVMYKCIAQGPVQVANIQSSQTQLYSGYSSSVLSTKWTKPSMAAIPKKDRRWMRPRIFVLKRMECCQQQIKIEIGSKDMSWHWLVIVMPATKPSEDEVRHKLKSKGIEHNAVSWVWAWG